METSDLIEQLIELGYQSYKRQNKNTIEWQKLQRHEPVIIEGQEFTCWREYVVYRTCEYIKDELPEAEVVCNLDGNNSNIELKIDDNEEIKINMLLKNFFKTLSI